MNDRMLPATRWAALVVFLILVPAVVVLWGMPSKAADHWAWPVKPRASPVFLGAGYGAGAYFFWRAFRARTWHPYAAGVLGASAFAALMLVATLVHWGKFNHGHAPFVPAFAFWGWIVVYVVAPPAVFVLWWRNRATDSGEPARGEPLVPDAVRLAARALGAAALLVAAVVFVAPHVAIDPWPWKLTPLTARVLASFAAQVGVGALAVSFDGRWGAWRIVVQAFFVATALLLIGAARTWSEFDHGVATYAYLAGLVGADVALAAVYVRLEPLGFRRHGPT